MPKTKPLRWGKPAEELVGSLVEEFQGNLRLTTIRAARHDQADSIDQKHVRQAYEFLVSVGLDRTSWYKRPQLKVTGSAFFLGTMLAVPDFSPVLFSDERQKAVVVGTMIVLGILSAALYVWSWMQNRI